MPAPPTPSPPQPALRTRSPVGAANNSLSCFSSSVGFPIPWGGNAFPCHRGKICTEGIPYPRAEFKAKLMPQRQADILSQNIHFTPQTQITALHREQISQEKWSHGVVCSWDVTATILFPCAALRSHVTPQTLLFPVRIFTLCKLGIGAE